MSFTRDLDAAALQPDGPSAPEQSARPDSPAAPASASAGASAQLLEAKRALRELAVGPDDVTAVIDGTGRLASVSSNCEVLLGYAPEELIGTSARSLVHPDDLRSLDPATRAFTQGLTDHLHSVQRMHRKQGGYALVETTVRAVPPPSSESPAAAVVVAKAPQAPARPAERPIVSFAPSAIGTAYAWVIEGSRRAVLASADPVFASLLGSSTAGLVGQALEELTDPASPATGRARLEALLDNSSATYQVERLVAPASSLVELTVSLLPLPDRPGQTAVIQARDVTRQREAERAAHESLTELERSNRELEAFASVAAHDLAAPLRVVVGYAETLASGENELNPQMTELVEKMARTSRRMQAQVDGLMMLARIESEELRTARHDLRDLLEEALGPLGQDIERLAARIEVGALPVAECNGTGVVQVFSNLLSNALKYGGPHPVITVGAIRGTGLWELTVADRGPGLPDGDERQLFELFERGPGCPGAPGAGIGLAVCRRIVERHGGRIWCSRRPGGGSEFHFELPDRIAHAGSDAVP